MACYKTIFRDQEATEFKRGSTTNAKLQRNYNYSHIWLELDVKYQAKLTSTFKYLHFANLILSLIITGNGNKDIKNIIFPQLVYQTYLLCRGRLPFAPPAVGTTDSMTSLSYTMRVLVPFSSLLMMKPSDTGLLSNQYQTLDYKVNWATEKEVGTDIIIDSAILRPVSWEKIETIEKGENISNLQLIQTIQTKQITASGSGILIDLPPNKWYQSIMFDCIKGDANDPAPVVGAIKNIKFLNGTDVVTQVSFESLQAENERRYDLDFVGFERTFKDEIEKKTQLNPRAHATLDFSAVGHQIQSSALQSWNTPQLSLDITLPSGVNSMALRLLENYIAPAQNA